MPQAKNVKPAPSSYRLYVVCQNESLVNARVKAAEKGETLAVTLGAAIDKAFANRKPSSKG